MWLDSQGELDGPPLDMPLDPRRVLPTLQQMFEVLGVQLLRSCAPESVTIESSLWTQIRARAVRIGWFQPNWTKIQFLFSGEPPMASSARHRYGLAVESVLAAQFFSKKKVEGDVLRTAFALAFAWARLDLSSHIPDWRLLRGVMAVEPGRKWRGHLRLNLDAHPEYDDSPVTAWLERHKLRGEGRLKPIKAKDLEHFEARVLHPKPGDLDTLRRLAALQAAERAAHLERGYSLSKATIRLLEQAHHQVFNALPLVSEVTVDGAPVEVMAERWPNQVVVEDGEAGHLRLRWAVQPVRLWPFGQGWVLDGEDQLWRLPEGMLAQYPGGPPLTLPEVFADEVDAFVNGWLTEGHMPVDLRTSRIEAVVGTPKPRLLVGDDDGELHLSVGFRYGEVDVPDDGGALLSGGGGLVRRDPVSEASLRSMLGRLVGRSIPCGLEIDDGYDFLRTGLPALEGWIVEADRKLVRVHHGALTPKVRVESGVDWFGMEVEFEISGGSVSLSKLLAAWRQRRRYVKLKDGSVAALPEQWMARYGAEVEELGELKRRDAQLRAPAAVALESLLAEAGADAERWTALAKKVRTFTVRKLRCPKALTATLRPYQLEGFRWMAALGEIGLGAVLADDMGLGKTVQTLALLIHRRKHGPALVVAPTSVIWNWQFEAQRFAPDLAVHVHHGPNRGTPPKAAQVVITSYALLRRDGFLAKRRWGTVVLDEAQNIKNPQTGVARAARELNAGARVALTGTPLENHLGELWSLFEFTVPGLFGSQEAFRKRYALPIEKDQDEEALGRLRARIHPFIMRRLKSEVALELPPSQEQVLYVDLPPAQRQLYEDIKGAYRDQVLKAIEEKGPKGATIQVLEALTRLRQACCHPGLVPLPQARGVQGSAKVARLMEVLEEAVEEGHRSLIFSQWPSFLKLVRAEITARGWSHLYLDGGTRERATLQARWNDPKGPPVFLISIKAGGSGLNLTGADHVFHLDPWWNPAVEQQATDRAHRIGQTKPVLVYKLVARDTAEEQILELQARKRALFEAAVDAERMVRADLTRGELEALFQTDGAAPKKLEIVVEPAAAPVAEPALETKPADPAWEIVRGAGDTVTTAQVQALLGGSVSVARRLIAGWVVSGQLVRQGRGRGTRYEVQ
jgi:superfamily II DNA or RNA helicase